MYYSITECIISDRLYIDLWKDLQPQNDFIVLGHSVLPRVDWLYEDYMKQKRPEGRLCYKIQAINIT